MADTNSVTVRFGGDAAGLSAAAAVAKEQLSAVNAEMKKLAKEAAASGGANDNLTKKMRETAVAAQKAKAEFASLSKGVSDNRSHFQAHGQQIGLNRMQMMEFAHISRSVFDELAAGGSPLRALALEGGRISQALGAGPNGAGGTLKALGDIAIKYSPLIAAGITAAGAALVFFAGSATQEKLVKLGELMRQTALSANELKGAEIIGSKVGIEAEAMAKGLQNAAEQYERFRRNTGEVKDAIEKFDKGFLKVADSAKTSGQFIDLVAQKIRSLPRDEGLDLAKALFGDETGEKLFRPIVEASISMENFRSAAKAAGVDLKDGAVHEAEQLQRQIDAAAQKAENRLLAAMQPIGVAVGKIKVEFLGVAAAIAEAAGNALKLVNALDRAKADGATAGAAIAALGKAKGIDTGEVFGPFQPSNAPLPPSRPAGIGAAGASRSRYESYEPETGGGSEKQSEIQNYIAGLQKASEAAKAELDSWGKGNVERQKAVALAGAEAAARKEGRDLTESERAKVVELATAEGQFKQTLEQVKQVQQEINSAMSTFSNDLASALDNAVIKGEKLNQVFKSLAQTLASSALKGIVSGALTGQGPFGNIFGTAAPAGSNQLGGLFGMLSGGLGLSNLFGGGAAAGGAAGGGLFSGFSLASLAGFLPFLDEGTNYVPHDMMAVIHKGERVMPAADNRAFTEAMKDGASGDGGASVSHNHNWNIVATDPRSFAAMLSDHDSVLAKAVKRAVESNPSLRAAY